MSPSGTLNPGTWLSWRIDPAICLSIESRDVDDRIGLVGAPVPELAHLVGLEPVARDLLGKVQMIARERIDGVGRRDAGLAMIAVLESADAVGIVNEDGVRPIPAKGAHDIAEKFARVLEPAVGIAEHDDVPHAHEVRGGTLLVGALARERGRRQCAVGSAGSAVRTEHVGHLAPRGSPLRHDAPGADLSIVRMREDHHRLVGNFGHDFELGGRRVSGHEGILQECPSSGAIRRGEAVL